MHIFFPLVQMGGKFWPKTEKEFRISSKDFCDNYCFLKAICKYIHTSKNDFFFHKSNCWCGNWKKGKNAMEETIRWNTFECLIMVREWAQLERNNLKTKFQVFDFGKILVIRYISFYEYRQHSIYKLRLKDKNKEQNRNICKK